MFGEIGSSKRILLVEDEAIIAISQAQRLKNAGYTVQVAGDGERAIEQLDAGVVNGQPFDLVLMDIDLGPGIDGTETARRMLEHHDVPIVFLTSHGEQEMVERVRTITRYGYVLKQSGEFVLLSSIDMALELFAAHQLEKRERFGLSHAYFQQLLHEAPEAVAILDTEDHIQDVNPEFERLFGYSQAEARGHRLVDLIVPDRLRDEALGNASSVIVGGDIACETTRRHKNGSEIEVAVFGKPVYFRGGQVAVFVMYRDLTAQRRTEAELRRKNQELQVLIDTVDTHIWFLTDERTYGIANQAHLDFLGRRRDEVERHALDEFLPEQEAAYCRIGNRRVFEERQAIQTEEWASNKDGEPRLLSMTKVPALDENGAVRYVVCSARDITEQRRMEEHSRVTTSMVESAADAIIYTDSSYRIIYMNPAAIQSTGWTVRELEGKTPAVFNAESDAEAIQADIRATIAAGHVYVGELRNRRKDGSIYHCQIKVSPVFDQDGRIVGYVDVQRDVSALKAARDTVRRKERELRAIIDSVPNYIFARDERNRFLFINRAMGRMFGIAPETVRGKTDLELGVSPELAAQFEVNNRAVIESRKPMVIKNEPLRRVDGTAGWFETRLVPFDNPAGGEAALVGVSVDITDWRNAEEENRRLLEEKQLLLREVHHRVKNNLMTVMSLLSLRASTLDDPVAVAALEESRGHVEAMMVVYDALNRSDDQRLIDLRPYLQALVGSVQRSYAHHGEISIEVEADSVVVDGSPAILLGIIVNELLTNAFKHAFPRGTGGTVWVTLRRVAEDRILLRVEDNGVGLPGGYERTTDRATSHGFGLTLLHGLVDQLNGTLEIGLGRGGAGAAAAPCGTSFEMSVPLISRG